MKALLKGVMLLLLFSSSMVTSQIIQDNTIRTNEMILADAKLYARKNNSELASKALVEYMAVTGDFDMLKNEAFNIVQDSDAFKHLHDTYSLKFEWHTFFYLYVGLIGIFIAIVLNFRRKSDKISNGLISGFVFMHSFFLIHLSLYLMNYTYRIPHTQSMSTWLSFLYGPILYFYFKRITVTYKFKWRDALHLIPTALYFVFFLPIYSLSSSEKLLIMMDMSAYSKHPYLQPVTLLKLASLLIYGYMTFVVYFKDIKKRRSLDPKRIKLQRTILGMHTIYTASYSIYGTLIIYDMFEGTLFNIQLLAMTSLVLYIGYIAYSAPRFLSNKSLKAIKPKYQNSGLTTSLSVELWEKLQHLLKDDKLYRQSDIKLETIADILGTTRHNASQIINEHSGLNFFELINQYRIEEAKHILSTETEKLSIIDIAYEVGYNNKVTFNKSFKRFSNVTPSQFRRELQASA